MLVVYTKPKSKWGVFGHAIRFFTKRKDQDFNKVPSHMQFVFGMRFSLEAVGGNGVRVGFFPSSIKHNDVIAVFDYSKVAENGWKDGHLITEGAFKYHGAKYDYLSIMWFAFYIIRKWMFGMEIPSKNAWDNNRAFFCSEMMEFIEESDQGHVDPNSQMLALKSHPDFELVFEAGKGVEFEDWFAPEMTKIKAMSRS